MNKRYEIEDKLLDILFSLAAKEEINIPEAKRQILALDGIAIVEREAKLPAFARVDVEGKPEVGRYYDGYKDGQEDMLEAGWVKEMKK